MWTDVVAWLGSAAGMRVIDGAVVPAVAIVVAGVLAALIARRALRATVARLDRQEVADAVAAAVEAADRAAAQSADGALAVRADVLLRLLPLAGAALAADWTGTAIAGIGHRDPQAASVADVRDRLVAWTAHPRRANALFAAPRRPRSADAAEKAAQKSGQKAAPAEESQTAPPAPPAAGAVPEPESGPLTEPVVLQREPDPALLAAIERELAGAEAHARHARPVEPPPQPSPVPDRATHHATAAHRERAAATGAVDEDDSAEVVADAREDAPEPVLAASLDDRRFATDSLLPDGAVPVTRNGHRATR